MLDTDLLRRDFNLVAQNLRRRQVALNPNEYEQLESRRKNTQKITEDLRAQRNHMARQIAQTGDIPEGMADFKSRVQAAENDMNEALSQIEAYLLQLPNMVDDSVPDGGGEKENVETRRWGTPREFDFTALDHVALGKQMGMMDFDTAAVLASARFVVLSSEISRLHRALAQFMLDLHTNEHGYIEYTVPYLANAQTMTGSGQLPKFGDEVFSIDEGNFYLIPTSEVALVNIARDRIIDAAQLPMRLVSHSPCFRREAGAYGKDTRGMIRQHQFDKVELVQITKPEDSYAALEAMTHHAARVLQLLELPYRVVALCGGDIGFAAAKTYDIEVWLPGQNCYREISSCSNCEAFQARRIKSRYRADDGKPSYVHTLNGSGVAVGRALVAVLENHQQPDGSVRVPPALMSYMGGQEYIGKSSEGMQHAK